MLADEFTGTAVMKECKGQLGEAGEKLGAQVADEAVLHLVGDDHLEVAGGVLDEGRDEEHHDDTQEGLGPGALQQAAARDDSPENRASRKGTNSTIPKTLSSENTIMSPVEIRIFGRYGRARRRTRK
jgi:protein involved in polysaccharide export with SLBB domain